MEIFNIPSREQLSPANQSLYDKVDTQLGFVPNLYSYMAKHPTALGDYLAFIGRRSTLTSKEKEAISLIVSELNGCTYCQSAHTALGKMNGFTEAETIDIRSGRGLYDPKLQAITGLAASMVKNKGLADQHIIQNFFQAGYSEEQFIDVVFVIADKIITNFIALNVAPSIDFPLASSINS